MDYFYPQRFQTGLTYLDEKGYKDYQKGKKVKKSIIKLKLKEITLLRRELQYRK